MELAGPVAQEDKTEAEVKGQERVRCSPVKHISVLEAVLEKLLLGHF